MPICKICGEKFPNRLQTEEKVITLHRRLHCLTCVPFGTRLKNDPIVTNKSCSICNRNYLYKPNGGNTLTKCNTCISHQRRVETKIKAVDYKGGKCIICGYSKCLRAMHFHHLDPTIKSFSISMCQNRSWKVVQAELDKCVLLCCRCHTEVEDGIADLKTVGGIEPLDT